MPKPLVIVESPAKARTLSRFLGKIPGRSQLWPRPGSARIGRGSASRSRTSVGTAGRRHRRRVHALLRRSCGQEEYVQALKAALKDASEVILATDPDREGESISWHLKELLKPKVKVRRIVFHEITEDAIKACARRGARASTRTWCERRRAAHSRSPVRLHAVASALEEGADRPERRARPERRGATDRRA